MTSDERVALRRVVTAENPPEPRTSELIAPPGNPKPATFRPGSRDPKPETLSNEVLSSVNHMYFIHIIYTFIHISDISYISSTREKKIRVLGCRV